MCKIALKNDDSCANRGHPLRRSMEGLSKWRVEVSKVCNCRQKYGVSAVSHGRVVKISCLGSRAGVMMIMMMMMVMIDD